MRVMFRACFAVLAIVGCVAVMVRPARGADCETFNQCRDKCMEKAKAERKECAEKYPNDWIRWHIEQQHARYACLEMASHNEINCIDVECRGLAPSPAVVGDSDLPVYRGKPFDCSCRPGSTAPTGTWNPPADDGQ